MKPLASVALVVLLAAVAATQPERERLYSTPSVPPREVLQRLNLQKAWAIFVPTLGRRDGILSFQIVPLWRGKEVSYQVLVQTRSGLVVLLNAETGQTLWRTRVGDAYRGTYAAGYNNFDVFVERGTRFFGLDRKTGVVRWKLTLSAAASAAPLADRHFLFLCLNAGQVAYYDLPGQRVLVPRLFRTYRSPVPLQMQPARTDKFLVYPSADGGRLAASILYRDGPGLFQAYRTGSTLLAPPGVHEVDEAVYIGSRDSTVSGNSLVGLEDAWHFNCGGAVTRSPFVNDDDVYAVGSGKGLFRLRRRTMDGSELIAYLKRRGVVGPLQLQEVEKALGGRARDAGAVLSMLESKRYLSRRQKTQLPWRGGDAIWRAIEGDRVHAVNPKFVYATDRAGRLLILDRDRGRRLSRYNVRDFVFPVSNELTDRLFLAANSGLVVCLHDRAYPTPVRMKKAPGAPPPPAPVKK